MPPTNNTSLFKRNSKTYKIEYYKSLAVTIKPLTIAEYNREGCRNSNHYDYNTFSIPTNNENGKINGLT